MNGGWIKTYTGGAVYPLNPEATSIDIRDIAHGLSLTCRFAGQCEEFYSVAQHSVLVTEQLPIKFRLAGLLHDASEAYLADIPRPVKSGLPDYVAAEAKLMGVIALRFGLPHPLPDIVKRTDTRMLATEIPQLLKSHRDIDVGVPPITGLKIKPIPPQDAEKQFLETYYLYM
jgi:hypothetical protein